MSDYEALGECRESIAEPPASLLYNAATELVKSLDTVIAIGY